MSEKYLEVYKALQESQSKYTYFILAAAGGAIVVTINQTQSMALSWSQLPLAAAVSFWGISILFGCFNISYVNAVLRTNAKILQIKSGNDPEFGSKNQPIVPAISILRDIFVTNSKRAGIMVNLQFTYSNNWSAILH
jgi:hypothetical protein